MSTITIRVVDGDASVTVKGHDNPYTDGPLVSLDSALQIATMWLDEQIDDDVVRGWSHVEGSAIVTAESSDASIVMLQWIAATEFHDFDRNAADHHGGGEEAYALGDWPFSDVLKWSVVG